MTMLPPYSRIAVLGGGAWGTALGARRHSRRDAIPFCGRAKTMWWPGIAQAGENKRFLPGVTLPKTLRVTGALAEAVRADALLLVVPAQVLADFAHTLAPLIAPGTPLVICAKGIEKEHRQAGERSAGGGHAAGRRPAILSGPSFARDVAKGLPTAVTIARDRRCGGALAGQPEFAGLPALCQRRHHRRGVGRRRQECLCHRLRRGRRPGPGRECARRPAGAQLRRTGAAGRSAGRQARNPDGPFGPGRSGADRHQQELAQFFLRHRIGPGQDRVAELEAPGHPLAEGVATAPALVKRARARSMSNFPLPRRWRIF